MKNTFTLLAIIVGWAVFLVWEVGVHQWLKNTDRSILRIDLVLLVPGLIGVTIYYLLKIKKETTEKP